MSSVVLDLHLKNLSFSTCGIFVHYFWLFLTNHRLQYVWRGKYGELLVFYNVNLMMTTAGIQLLCCFILREICSIILYYFLLIFRVNNEQIEDIDYCNIQILHENCIANHRINNTFNTCIFNCLLLIVSS